MIKVGNCVRIVDGFGEPYLSRELSYEVHAVHPQGDSGSVLVELSGRLGLWPFLPCTFRVVDRTDFEERMRYIQSIAHGVGR